MDVAGISSDLEQELKDVSAEIESLDHKITELQRERRLLEQKKDKLIDAVNNRKHAKLASRDWGTTGYPWSANLEEKMKTVFGISSLRPHQLPTMNASLSGQDVLLLMPTGGGKSLCFQLPAVISKGFTLVISPLVALMEDQIMALKKKNVAAEMLNASTPKNLVTQIQNEMTDKKSTLKLLYVTPEKLAKSKRFMAKLQKAFEMGRLDRIAIDEVHCCSQWGHDFRKDYKFLGILKTLFPSVPLIGLTATAPSAVLADVQKILNIEGCLVFRASFNRPNLYYEVRPKPSSHKECVDEIEKLLKFKYSGQSGIIYTTSIKDTEELMNDLRSRGLKVGCYHANLNPDMRSKCHQKWISNYYQAVVATIAFGMGMDKPDVRFVIHHSLSKSMANFYQESGRAGRDDQPADCILFYRFADLFRVSTMVFAEETGLENIYGMVGYCLDSGKCRRKIIATHFEEIWESVDCDKMCDHCRKPRDLKSVDITNHCQGLGTILKQAGAAQLKVTGQKLVDAWLGKGQANLKVVGSKPPSLSREMCEHVVAYLLLEGYMKEDFHFTPYSTISYILPGPRMAGVLSGKATVHMELAGKQSLSSKPAPLVEKSPTASKLTLCDIPVDGGSPLRTVSEPKKSSESRKNSKENGQKSDANGVKKRANKPKEEVKKKKAKIESDSSDEDFDLKTVRNGKGKAKLQVKSDSSSSECEIVREKNNSLLIVVSSAD